MARKKELLTDEKMQALIDEMNELEDKLREAVNMDSTLMAKLAEPIVAAMAANSLATTCTAVTHALLAKARSDHQVMQLEARFKADR